MQHRCVLEEQRRPPPTGTAAWFRDKTDEQLEDVLRGGTVGNKHVDGALAEINRRAAQRQEGWSKKAYRAAVVAAAAAVIGAIGTWIFIFR